MSTDSTDGAASPPQFRAATAADSAAMHRLASARPHPDYATPAHYEKLASAPGPARAFVCQKGTQLVGFCVVDAARRTVSALYVAPSHDQTGIGKVLLEEGAHWLGAQATGSLTLTSAADTRAAGFFDAAGWRRTGVDVAGAIGFEWKLP